MGFDQLGNLGDDATNLLADLIVPGGKASLGALREARRCVAALSSGDDETALMALRYVEDTIAGAITTGPTWTWGA